MSTITMDVSEFDALRNQVKEKEERIKELLADNEEYKKNTRVIIKTHEYCVGFDRTTFSKAFTNHFSITHSIVASLEYAIEESKCRSTYYNSSSNRKFTYESIQYINFDDIKNQVEQDFKEDVMEEYENKLLELEQSKKQYDKKFKELDDILAENHKKEIDALRDNYNEQIKVLKEKIVELEEHAKILVENNLEVCKSKEQRIKEAQDIIKEQEAKINSLKDKRKFLFWRI